MFQKVVVVMVLMPFIFAGQAKAMEPEPNSQNNSPKFKINREKSNQPKNVFTNISRMTRRISKNFPKYGQSSNFENPDQSSESGAANDQELVDLAKQHIKFFPLLFSEENPTSVSNFLKDLEDNKLLRGLLLRDCDDKRHILMNIENDYSALFVLATSNIQDSIRGAEEDLNFHINMINSDRVLTYKTQLNALNIMLEELLKHYVLHQKYLLDLETHNTESIESTKNSVDAFYKFFKEHHPVIFQIRKERCIFVQSLKKKYVYNTSSLVENVNSNPFLESDAANNEGLFGLVKQHTKNYSHPFSEQGRKELSDFVSTLKNSNSELSELKEIEKDYETLVTFTTSINTDKATEAETEITDRIVPFISDKNKTSTYKKQYKTIKTISKELQEHPKKYHGLILQIKKERCIFIQSLENQYIYLTTINNYPTLIAQFENKLEKRKASDAKGNSPPDSRISGSLSSPKNSDESQSPKNSGL